MRKNIRTPISGKVIDQVHVAGRFLDINFNARRLLREAERNILTLKDPVNNITVIAIQLASNSVRRIISFVNKGENLDIGQRYGYVKFGSQVDLVFPDLNGLRFNIKKGDKVYGGETIIVRYDPILKAERRWHTSVATIQKSFRKAVLRAQIRKHATPHTMRHSFA